MLVMTIVLGTLLLVVNIYLLAYFCHPDDRGFGSALICKIVVVKLKKLKKGTRYDAGLGTSFNVTFRCF